MSANNSEIIGDNGIHLLDELQTLLERQIESVRQDKIRDVEVLSEQTDSLVDRIAQTGILSSTNAAFDEQRREQLEQLQKLYEDLCLAITAQKAVVCEELGRVRKGKKTIQTYRSHI